MLVFPAGVGDGGFKAGTEDGGTFANEGPGIGVVGFGAGCGAGLGCCEEILALYNEASDTYAST